jgi:signal transduction histidine kinase
VGDSDASFSRLVLLAAHDLRTPLATIHGFAQTLVRMGDLGEPRQRYMEMIDSAALQLAELLDELGLAARIAGGRYDPARQEVDTLQLARGAAEELGPERVNVAGQGTEIEVDVDATQRGVSALVQAALRHGGLEQVDVRVDGPKLAISPVTPSSGPVLLGQDLRDLGAAVAVILIKALGGSVSVDGDTLAVNFPE